MAVQHRTAIERSISRLQQSAYLTARNNAADFRRIISDQQALGSRKTEFADDAAYEQGTDLANEKWATMNSASMSLTPDFCFEDIGYLLLDVLGGYSVSQPDSLGNYAHVLTPQSVSSSRQFGTRTILEKRGSLPLILYRDMACTNLSISGGKVGRLKVSATYEGSGYYEEDPAGYSSPAIVADREWAYAQQASLSFNTGTGTAQVETATAAGTITGTGNATVVVTGANISGSPVTVSVAVTNTDTAATWAAKVRNALRLNKAISSRYAVSGATTAIILTDRTKAANDGTLNISLDNGTCTGITTAASSANTTAGVAGVYQSYSCDLSTWSIAFNQPAGDDGYRQCSAFLVSDTPVSGVIRGEYLIGQRSYTVNFTARMNTSDPMRGYMKNGTELSLDIAIVGTDTNDRSLRIAHTKARVVDIDDQPDVDGFIGFSGTLDLMASSGTIPLTCTLINAVASYSS